MGFEKYAKPILRISLSLIFLYFGLQQLISPENWVSFVPSFLSNSEILFVRINSVLELTFGTFLLLGIYTRFVSLVLSFNLFVIAFSIGLNPLGIRDLGLAISTFVVFLNGPDWLCVSKKK